MTGTLIPLVADAIYLLARTILQSRHTRKFVEVWSLVSWVYIESQRDKVQEQLLGNRGSLRKHTRKRLQKEPLPVA